MESNVRTLLTLNIEDVDPSQRQTLQTVKFMTSLAFEAGRQFQQDTGAVLNDPSIY